VLVRIASAAAPVAEPPGSLTGASPARRPEAASPLPADPPAAPTARERLVTNSPEPAAFTRFRLIALRAQVAGAAFVLALAAWRFARFRRLLDWAEPPPPELAARTAALAARLGLAHVPRLLVVPARIPPMLWPEPGGARLLLPRELLAELTPAERDALLAHELAHVRRRDHWVRLVETLATSLFWWYPLSVSRSR